MSMQLLTFLQLICVIAIYLGVVVLIPAAVFHGKFEDHPFYVRYTAYTCIGNFYLINLVFLLQLLHVSNRVTLILGVVIPALVAIAVFHWQDWVKASLMTAGETTKNVIGNTMGFRLFFARIFQNLGQAVLKTLKAIGENLMTKWFDWIGTIIIIVIVCWQYGTNLFRVYGYTASDMLVHNYWINAMGQNDVFVAGVYPFGFHCILYFIHAVFGIETYVLLRVFSLVETLLIHLTLLFILRLVCRSESASYIALGFYLLLNVWGKNSYTRYYSALPQEYGMIFILPAIFFLILFFREREEENGEKGLKGKRSTPMLYLFAINVCLTFAAHFYDTIALGIFCIAVGVAFCKLVFRKDFIFRIVGAGAIGLVIAVFPLWFAHLAGTPLEGSLRWGMSVMNGKTQQDPLEIQLEMQLNESMAEPSQQDNLAIANAQSGAVTYSVQASVAKTAGGSFRSFFVKMATYLSGFVFISQGSSFGGIVLFLILLGFVMGALNLLRRETEPGRMMLAASLNLLLFCFLLMSRELGIPVLMDKNRCSIYLAYFLIVLLGLVLDGLISFAMNFIEGETLKKVFPAVFAVVCFMFLGLLGWVRVPEKVEAFQKNGAIICVTNILRENPRNSFNIISANDELRMTEDYGYHVEAKELLVQNMGDNVENYFAVPSTKTYVFIEKIPSEYDEPYAGSGAPVSEESASQPLPYHAGFGMYKGYYRHVTMSKLYYWAQTFRKMFENEISVYYEDDEFICYEIRQNVDRPFDLSFDYGFNN